MLTHRQLAAYEFITGFIERERYAPSYEEIRRHLGLRSLNAVAKLVAQLRRRRALAEATPNAPIHPSSRVACGNPGDPGRIAAPLFLIGLEYRHGTHHSSPRHRLLSHPGRASALSQAGEAPARARARGLAATARDRDLARGA